MDHYLKAYKLQISTAFIGDCKAIINARIRIHGNAFVAICADMWSEGVWLCKLLRRACSPPEKQQHVAQRGSVIQ